MFPFHSESERDYYAWVGLYATTWATAELSLGRLIDFIYQFRNGAAVEKEQPLNLERRLKFLQRAAKSLSDLQAERDEILAMMGALKIESEFRHLIIHGAKLNWRKADPHYSYLSRPRDRKNPKGEKVEMEVTATEIEQRYHTIGMLALCLLGCQRRLMDQLDIEIKQAGG